VDSIKRKHHLSLATPATRETEGALNLFSTAQCPLFVHIYLRQRQVELLAERGEDVCLQTICIARQPPEQTRK
jgi:hypothetical protein